MSYCTSKGVGYLGWSWKGNNSDMSYLDIANSWDGSSLSSWGNTLINVAVCVLTAELADNNRHTDVECVINVVSYS